MEDKTAAGRSIRMKETLIGSWTIDCTEFPYDSRSSDQTRGAKKIRPAPVLGSDGLSHPSIHLQSFHVGVGAHPKANFSFSHAAEWLTGACHPYVQRDKRLA